MKANLIEAFGETKTIKDWAKDDRCAVEYEPLRGRLKSGKFTAEEAISTSPLKAKPGGDLEIGDHIHRFTIKNKFMKDHYGQNATYVVVDCDCGTKGLELPLRRILDNNTRSCGCLQSEIQSERAIERNYKHGKGNLEYRLYREWCAMKGRCYTASSTNFQHWGGKGVTVCNEWREDFEIFEKWALENGYTDKLTIERKDVNGHYEPSNCKWITLAEQQLNKTNSVLITAWGETKNLTTWGRDPRCKIDYRMIKWRIDNGWDAETAISKPPQG